jgi:hypothetical protein
LKRVALLTYGHVFGEIGTPILQDYVDLSVSVSAAYNKIPGFIEKVPYPVGLVPPFFNKEKYAAFVTILSVWTAVEPIVSFSYYGPHGESLRRKKDWFYDADFPTNVGWWIDGNDLPTWEEAFERQCYLHEHGPTSHAFPLRKPFDAEGNPYIVNRSEIRRITDSMPELKKAKQ